MCRKHSSAFCLAMCLWFLLLQLILLLYLFMAIFEAIMVRNDTTTVLSASVSHTHTAFDHIQSYDWQPHLLSKISLSVLTITSSLHLIVTDFFIKMAAISRR